MTLMVIVNVARMVKQMASAMPACMPTLKPSCGLIPETTSTHNPFHVPRVKDNLLVPLITVTDYNTNIQQDASCSILHWPSLILVSRNGLQHRINTNKCSAVAEMGDRLATIDMGQKVGGFSALFSRGQEKVGSRSNCGAQALEWPIIASLIITLEGKRWVQ